MDTDLQFDNLSEKTAVIERDESSFFNSTKNSPKKSRSAGMCSSLLTTTWRKTFGKIQEDWLFLTLLGISMAWISLLMDYVIGICTKSRIYLYKDLVSHPLLQYFAWICIPVCLILFSTAFTKLVAPQAAGSGIPEMKTTLKGIILKKSFSLKALVAKIIGLTTTLGTGLPLGKEGPFVHIASIASMLLAKATTNSRVRGIYQNKSRATEMLAAACAVGVATAFSSPVGGVLFSIEVTAVHFAVRNYWRGFYAAVCATVMSSFIAVWFKDEATLTAPFKTSFTHENLFAPQEIFAFALIGVLCGLLGALFVWVHRKYVTFKTNNAIMKWLSTKNVLLYPFIVTLTYTSLTFPLGLGMFVSGRLTTHQQMTQMFANFSWQSENPSVYEYSIIKEWQSNYTDIYVHLIMYILFIFFGSIVASTIPVPAGIFIPVFKIGAGLGRLIGELMAETFPNGLHLGIAEPAPINPGGYAIVGAAAMAGAATHTVSSSVIAFELTGQLSYAIPVMVAVFIANGVMQALQPSIFDSIITLKKLPYLPSIPSTSSKAYDIFVEDFMIRDVKFVWYGITYDQLKTILIENDKIKAFPLVDSADSMILLGSAHRKELISLIEDNVRPEKKIHFLNEWKHSAEKSLIKKYQLNKKGSQEVIKKDTDLQQIDKPSELSEPLPKPWMPSVATATKDQEIKPLSASADALLNDDIPLPLDYNPNYNRERRPSRFSVTKVEEDPLIPLPSEIKNTVKEEKEESPNSVTSTLTTASLPMKSILKKTQSFVFEPNTSRFASKPTYATIHAGETRSLKNSLSSILRAKTLLRMDSRTSSHITFTGTSRADLPIRNLLQKIKEFETEWETKEMKKTVDFSKCQINPSPHQLVERSNLLQVHSIFSLLGLHHSYVTAIGRLIGVVGLKELRIVIEQANSRDFSRTSTGSSGNRKFSFGFLTRRRPDRQDFLQL